MPTPSEEHVEDFVSWLKQPPRNARVPDPSVVQCTERTIQSFIEEHGEPRGRGHVLGNRMDSVWWTGWFVVRDYGAYRLTYMGD